MSFIYGKESIDNVNSEFVFREYTYKVKEKEIVKNIPEFFIEGITKDNTKVAIDFLALIEIDEMNSFDLDEEIYFNDYLISSELFLGINNEYKNIDVENVDMYLTRIDKNYFNIRIEIPSYEIIIEYELKFETKEESEMAE
ncbi:MAG: hypothetical protein IKF37_00210 [Bacilli bacterium]|nr:hypothetical protein [Bacilli bacterium]MBR2997484.1 hypothetical protein [Bacilli bacterium]